MHWYMPTKLRNSIAAHVNRFIRSPCDKLLSLAVTYIVLINQCKKAHGDSHGGVRTCMKEIIGAQNIELQDRVCKHVFRCTRKRVPTYLILGDLFINIELYVNKQP